ncbi:MAG: hypothetical protein BGO59_17025 [Spirosoma sp. 48-14]|nr:MAG: hypothetical protein BGO59_17025 [Spirosoma sp. 48-14]
MQKQSEFHNRTPFYVVTVFKQSLYHDEMDIFLGLPARYTKPYQLNEPHLVGTSVGFGSEAAANTESAFCPTE